MLGLLDESVPESSRGVHDVIGSAVLIDPAQRDEVAARAHKLIDGRLRAFHWKDEGTSRRSAMIDLLGQLDLGMFAVIHHPVAAKRQVDARRRSLRTLASIRAARASMTCSSSHVGSRTPRTGRRWSRRSKTAFCRLS